MSPRSRRYGGGGLRAPKEVNTRKCHVCGAEKGDTCFVLTEKTFRELRETHRTAERKRAALLAAEKNRPMVLDRTL
jgi:hypothetical protein